ncbi:MAG: YggT family protein [Rhodocyclaceae bacterium]|nr:YggT family protein [Rhodocyclaceae bacterium]
MIQLLIFIGSAVVDFLCAALLIRFIMQLVRLTFINPLGRFILAVTEWIVRPTRRWIPKFQGVDLSPLVLAWLIQCLWLVLMTSNVSVSTVMGVATLEIVRLLLHLAMGIVIVSAVLSWVNPYAPLAPLFNALSRPLLRPLRRFIPPIGGVDLSPLVLLLLLQILLSVIDSLRFGLLSGVR